MYYNWIDRNEGLDQYVSILTNLWCVAAFAEIDLFYVF